MSLQRQYNLPNCRIILQGLSNNNTEILDILTNAECHFTAQNQVLSGGQVFWQNLVTVVNNYAQESLSGLRHPLPPDSPQNLISLTRNEEKFTHHLTFQPETETSASETSPTIELELNTVQLFDLIEAIDQFFADTNTLPDFKPPLQPLSKRFRRPDEPIIQRATPPLLGLLSVALASFALFLIPIPERKPMETNTQGQPTETLPPPVEPQPSGTENGLNPQKETEPQSPE